MSGTNFVKRAGSLPSNLWARTNTSRFTALYIIFIVVFSITQIGLRARVYSADRAAYDSLDTILETGRSRTGGIPILSESGIQLCKGIDAGSCSTVWDSNSTTHILAREDPSVLSDSVCLQALNYPVYVLHSDMREDAVTLALQVFSLGLGFTAIAQQHVSHFVTNALIQIISVAWAIVRVKDTGLSASDFERVITNGACGGELLGNFWSQRWGLDIAILAVDILGFLLSIVFSYKAAQNLGLTQAKSSSNSTNHLYKVMVAALVAIELSLFFSMAAGALWLDQLFFLHGRGGDRMGMNVAFGLAELIMAPILILGWVALHREMWKSVLTFLAFSLIYLVGWGVTFVLESFRWTINTWNLFGFLVVAAFILAFVTFTCTLVSACHFGKGMKQISQGAVAPQADVHILGLDFPRNSESSMEKGQYSIKELRVDSFDEKVVAPIPTRAYTPAGPRVPKHKATAIARGLTVTPPPL